MTVTKMIALLYTMSEHTEVLAWDLPSERYQPVVEAILHVNKETLTSKPSAAHWHSRHRG